MKNIPASVYTKLQSHARQTGRPFQEILVYYGMERFLARMVTSRHRNKFILKGALLFHIWDEELSRSTRDIDFLGKFKNDLNEIETILKEICSREMADGVDFRDSSIRLERIKEDADYEGVRASFVGQLSTAKIPIQIDIGFGDTIEPSPEVLEFPTLFKESVFEVKSYPKETVVAEKLQAMVALDLANSRMKDFFDIWLLSRIFNFDGETLKNAIVATFKNRKTEIDASPTALSDVFAQDGLKRSQWMAFRKRLSADSSPETLDDLIASLSHFLGPVLEACASGSKFEKIWSMGRIWKGKVRE